MCIAKSFEIFFNFNLWNKISGLLFCFFLLPSVNKAEEQKWSVTDLKSVFIQATTLKIHFQDKESDFYTIKSSKGFSFKKEEGQLKIQSVDFPSKKRWSESQEELELSFSGPSLPIELFSSSSKVSVSGWKSSLFISSFKADIELQNIKGNSQIDLYEGQVVIKNHQGALKLKSFQANMNLIKSQGEFDFQVNQGKLKIKKSAGQLNFTGNNLKVNMLDFNGDIRGFTELGEVKASLKPKKLELKTGTAPVRLYVRGQGAKISAYTKEGQIYVPKYLYKKYEGKSIRVSGRLRSKTKAGSVKIETGRGEISIY